MTFQLILPFAISSHATLGGAPWLARVTQPGFRKQHPPASFVSRNVRVPVQDKINVIRQMVRRYMLEPEFQSASRKVDNEWPIKLLSQFPRTTVT